ncbi:MAG: amidohydrolase family protein [Candidatus Rifleibacteriota bacterium]
MLKLFRNGTILDENFELKKADLLIQDDVIQDILEPATIPDKEVDAEINIKGQFVFPGFINAHDHLIDTCWKGLGDCPAGNWYEWRKSVRASQDYKDMQKLSVTDLYVLGMYKNILSGATTVVDHFPVEISSTFYDHPLTSLVEDFNMVHSVSSKGLEWGRNITEEYRNTRGITPFITHIGQGNSEELTSELETLKRLGALESNTILVDCCFLTDNDLNQIADNKASIVWLPGSSQNIFSHQPNIKKIIELGISLAIGTDGSNTGSGDMLEELRKALDYCRISIVPDFKAKEIIKMATETASEILGINKQVGSIKKGKKANLIVFEAKENEDPFEALLQMNSEELSMVIHNGLMIVGDDRFRKVSAIDFQLYSEVRINDKAKILYGRPLELIDRLSHKLNREIKFPFFNVKN